jgi:zona occludens toxin (predicted ATPase)
MNTVPKNICDGYLAEFDFRHSNRAVLGVNDAMRSKQHDGGHRWKAVNVAQTS